MRGEISCTQDVYKALLNTYILNESIKYTFECISLMPRVQDHSNNDLENKNFSSITDTCTSLNVQLFLSPCIAQSISLGLGLKEVVHFE